MYLKSKIRLSTLLDLKFAKTSDNSSSKVEVNWLYKMYPDLPSEFSIISEWKIGFFSNDYSVSNILSVVSKTKTQYYGDVRNFNNELLNGIDKVVYLAAISNDPMGNNFKEPTFDINENCAYNIAKAAKDKILKILFMHQVVLYMEQEARWLKMKNLI